LLERASPYLLELNRRSGETVNLGEPAGLEMVYIGRFPSPLRSIVHMPIGRRLPMYTASAGRAYLSGLPEHDARAILEASDRVKFTPRTVTAIEPLMEMLAQAREQGYAYSNEEYYRGDLALAVPVHDVSQRVVAAVNVSVSTSDWTLASAIDQFVPLMLDTARLISTTPPSLQALSPFRIGFAGMTPL
jgi:IclR family pca regulon transcriptional regulator